MHFRKYRLRKTWVDKCLKGRVPEDAWRDKLPNRSKNCRNLNESTFTKIVNHSGADYVGKSLF